MLTMRLAAIAAWAVVWLGCTAAEDDDPAIGLLVDHDAGEAAQEDNPAPKPSGPAYDWSNCGRPWAYPFEACQIAPLGYALIHTIQIPEGSTLDAISVQIDPWNGHYEEPEHKPRVVLHVFDGVIGNWFDIGPAIDDRTLKTDYESPHKLWLDVEVVGQPNTFYAVEVYGESGKYTLSGLKALAPTLTFLQ